MDIQRDWTKAAFLLGVPILFLAVIACQPAAQQPFNEEELRRLVREEVHSQVGAFNSNISGDLGPLKACLGLDIMEPLSRL